jgi:heptosyltransferase III
MNKHRDILLNAKDIAIIRTDKLGDMVLTLPMLNAIKEFCPKANIHIIASIYTQLLLENQPLIYKYHLIEDNGNKTEDIFKNNKFDVIFFPRPRFGEIFSAFRYRIPLRVGSAYRWYSFLLNHRVFEHRKYAEKSEAQYNVGLVNSVSENSHNAKLVKPFIGDNAIDDVSDLFISSKKTIIIHPGGGGSAPKWSAENFGNLASLICENENYQVLISGTNSESKYTTIVSNLCPKAVNICSKYSLEQLLAIISKSACLISNSTGILHIAAALGIKVMGFYPNTPSMSSKRWGALTDKAVFLSPEVIDNNQIENDNLNRINVEQAFKAFLNLMN